MEYFEILLLLPLLLLLLLIALSYHKIRKVHLSTFELIERTRDIDQETKQTYRQLQAYIDLKALLDLAKPLPQLRGWAASPDFLLEIAKHALKSKPQCIVECSSGASTLVLARCAQLSNTGHVVSLEHDERFAQITRDNLQELGLAEWAKVVFAPLEPAGLEVPGDWYAAAGYENLQGIDMLVVDGPPANQNQLARYPAMPKLAQHLAKEALIFLDDTDRPGEREIISRWLRDTQLVLAQEIALEKGAASLQFQRSTAKAK